MREVAAGKKTVVITFDDLTRATPTYTIVPWVLSELKAAGIEDENILFLGSFATHRPMTALEVQKKLGKRNRHIVCLVEPQLLLRHNGNRHHKL